MFQTLELTYAPNSQQFRFGATVGHRTKVFRLPYDWSDSAVGVARRCVRVRLSKDVDYLIDNLCALIS